MRQSAKNWGFAAAGLTVGLLAVGGAMSGTSRAQTPAPAAQTAPITGNWDIDPMHTNVNFAIRHMGISIVRGRFDDVSGTIVANEKDPSKSSVNVTIQAASIDTNVKMRDDHLRSPDFFNVAQYPTITFRSTSVEKRRGGFTAKGILTMHGVAKEISLPFVASGPVKDPNSGFRAGAETQIHLNRQDFGIKYNAVLDNGSLAVGNDVDVTISLEAVPAKPATTTP